MNKVTRISLGSAWTKFCGLPSFLPRGAAFRQSLYCRLSRKLTLQGFFAGAERLNAEDNRLLQEPNEKYKCDCLDGHSRVIQNHV